MKCPHDGTQMIDCNIEEWPAFYCPNCPHVQYATSISEEDRSLYDLGCSCGPCKQAGKKKGLRYE